MFVNLALRAPAAPKRPAEVSLEERVEIMCRRVILTAGLTLLTMAPGSAADQWPQFRGSHAGVAPDDPALPDTWSATQNVVWKTDIPGDGWSSPVVWDDHVFVTAAISS